MSGINEQVINAEIYQIGPQGIPGDAATISVGTVTTGEPGTDASVTNSGTSSAAILDFVIPQGEQGLQGIQGPQGIQGLTGATGNGISSIEKITTVGLTDTYRITFTNNTYYDFEVINGSSISDIEKTNTSGLVDTYTITLTNGNTHTFTVTNGAKGDKGETGEVGNGILGVNKMSTTGLVDNYRMTFTNGTYFDYSLDNAKSIVSISKIMTTGLVDTYRITFNDGSNFQFPVTNGNGVSGVTLLSWVGLDKTYRMTFTNGTYFDFVVSNGAEGQAEWGGISGVLSNQHDLQDALDAKAGASQTHALKGYEDNGELLTDPEGLADVINYAHSSFDLSKFTVVGTPTISADGVASGFSSSNYLQKLSILPTEAGHNYIFKMRYKHITNDFSTTGYIFNVTTTIGDYFGVAARLNPRKLSLVNTISGATEWIDANTLEENQIYDFEVRTDFSTYLDFYVGGELKGSKTYSATGYPNTGNVLVGASINRTMPLTMGSIDLKQFSIAVDGIPVFSGNRTGIDTIKPDDYTVVNSGVTNYAYVYNDGTTEHIIYSNSATAPQFLSNADSTYYTGSDFTISNNVVYYGENVCTYDSSKNVKNYIKQSDDGIVTFPSNYNTGVSTCVVYAIDKSLITNKSNWHLQFQSYFPNQGTLRLMQFSAYNSFQDLSYTPGWNSITLQLYDINSASIFTSIENIRNKLSAGAITVDIYYSSIDGYYFTITQNGITYTSSKSSNTNQLTITSQYFIALSKSSLINHIKLDLNTVKLYVDGSLVYQPCLKIPYTQSKTGSKIVNAIYRNRVNDMASQFGYANYYTLDEDNGNFTLPQVELYGLIGDKTLRDSYYNGVTYWELFSNRRLEQGGSCESGVEYTLPKPFADSNYVLTIPYSSKTATSFIPSATGDFIAKGTGLL